MPILKTAPAVFAVGKEYQILVWTRPNVFASVQAGDSVFYDAHSGVVNSLSSLHRIAVPMEILDRAGGYTLLLRPVVERIPYFTKTETVQSFFFPFYPVPEQNIRAFHISDAHGHIRGPLAAARAFGPMDALILNGDLIDFCTNTRSFQNIYKLCAELTGGRIPVVFSRGNHDMRGRIAEKHLDYIPHQNRRTYYTFRLGSIWGVVLDCGEDKPDEHDAYGGTVACHSFRQAQTAFLKEVIANADQEYAEEGVTTRLVLSHIPFTEKNEPPFDIEEDIYREWTALLKEHIKPHLMICGHTHQAELRPVGHLRDTYGQSCPVVIASGFDNQAYWTGCGFAFGETEILITFTDSNGCVLRTFSIPK